MHLSFMDDLIISDHHNHTFNLFEDLLFALLLQHFAFLFPES